MRIKTMLNRELLETKKQLKQDSDNAVSAAKAAFKTWSKTPKQNVRIP